MVKLEKFLAGRDRPSARRGLVVCLVVLVVVSATAALAWPEVGMAAGRSSADHVVVVRAQGRSQSMLLRMLRARSVLVPDPSLVRSRLSDPRSAGGPRFARTAAGSQPFRILSDGYLPRRDYNNAVGRLYSVSANGRTLAACTATVVGPSVVLTAAHCVHDPETGRDYAGFLFVPGMRGHSAPAGTWTGTSAEYWSQWARAPKVSLDYAFVTLDANQNGQHVGDLTGHFGIVEYARPRRVLAEGYPGTGPFSHNCTLTACRATYCYSPLSAVIRGAYGYVFGIGCVTGQGSSGGPWFVRFHGRWAIGSVTSMGLRLNHANYFRVIFGPQFGSRLNRLLRAAESS